jgi:hypothetical protein
MDQTLSPDFENVGLLASENTVCMRRASNVQNDAERHFIFQILPQISLAFESPTAIKSHLSSPHIDRPPISHSEILIEQQS